MNGLPVRVSCAWPRLQFRLADILRPTQMTQPNRTPAPIRALTPNINFQAEEGSGTSFITIRGIAQVRNSEQPVAVVMDSVAQISARQLNQELFDITQIEVLKGPQGALYGNNSIGGAINITTAEPGEIFGGYVQVGTGTAQLWR